MSPFAGEGMKMLKAGMWPAGPRMPWWWKERGISGGGPVSTAHRGLRGEGIALDSRGWLQRSGLGTGSVRRAMPTTLRAKANASSVVFPSEYLFSPPKRIDFASNHRARVFMIPWAVDIKQSHLQSS